jgi:nucleotide-binding universal stress UspA family protein
MFRKLLIPLDGSKLAEAALEPAAYLADRLGSAVALIHIIERDSPDAVHGERHLSDPDEAQAYLEEVAARTFPKSVKIECHVHTSFVRDVPQSISDHVDEFAPDLIVMCTHGRSGLGVRLFGSIALQVVGLGVTPVLLVQPTGEPVTLPFECHKMLVPLDGNPVHEEGLSVAAGLAEACGASLHLVTVIQTLGTLTGQTAATGRLLPGATSAMLDLDEESAGSYLKEKQAQLHDRKVRVTSSVQRGDPSGGIVHAAFDQEVDVIVLGTHGRSGFAAFWEGSVGAAVASRSHLPLLLVPIR